MGFHKEELLKAKIRVLHEAGLRSFKHSLLYPIRYTLPFTSVNPPNCNRHTHAIEEVDDA